MLVVSSQWLKSSPSSSRRYHESESSRKSFKLATRIGLESSRCDSSQQVWRAYEAIFTEYKTKIYI